MNWLDIVIAIILVINLFIGLRQGLIKMVIAVVGLILAILLAGHYYQALANRLSFIPSEIAAEITSYILILVVVMVVAAMAAWVLSKVASIIMLGWLNHLGGAVLGLFMASIFIGAILAIWAKYAGGGELIGNSVLGGFLLDKFPLVLALLPNEFDTVRSFIE